jgi:ABC-2 type transport system permease protein
MLRTLVASRIDYYIGTLSLLVLQVSSLVFILIAFSRKSSLAGYSKDEVMLFFAVAFTVQALVHCFTEGLWLVGPKYVLKGELDYLMVRPMSPLLQIVMGHLHSSGIINLALGVGMIAHSLRGAVADPSAGHYLLVAYYVVVGFIIQFSLILMIASLSFLHGKVTAIVSLFMALQQFLAYPLDLFPQLVIVVFTFVLPLAFSSYFPVLELIGRSHDRVSGSVPFAIQLSVVGAGLFLASLTVWSKGVSRYQSPQG